MHIYIQAYSDIHECAQLITIASLTVAKALIHLSIGLVHDLAI